MHLSYTKDSEDLPGEAPATDDQQIVYRGRICSRFTPCGAIWLYDRTEGIDARDPVVFERLGKVLKQTLDEYLRGAPLVGKARKTPRRTSTAVISDGQLSSMAPATVLEWSWAPQQGGPAIAGQLHRLPDPAGVYREAGAESSTAGIGAIAGSIRQTMSKFTPGAVSAYLYDAAHEVSPQRLWQAFLVARHTLVTSWVRARAYDVDFCTTRGVARYVQGVMSRMNGLLQVMDVTDTGDFDVRRLSGEGDLLPLHSRLPYYEPLSSEKGYSNPHPPVIKPSVPGGLW
ncbi:hypothetical protein DL769_004247 [Monosporascus sp. CRB-8-3]|nr:hypothetical protein DL769_004247 [Monosporascus sp. CRB-8-3]